jgi:plastocyanin
MRRFRNISLAAVTALAVFASTASAETVGVYDGRFTPADITITPGTAVTWNWSSSGHNVSLSGAEAFTTPFNNAGASFTHTFTTPGSYTFICEAHPSEMRGRVVVAAANAAAPAAPSPAATPPAPAQSPGPPPAVQRASASGAFLTFTLSRPARVRGAVERRTRRGWRVVAHVTADGAAGANTLRWTTRRIGRGIYRVTLIALDDSGRATPAARARFSVARAVPASDAVESSPAPHAVTNSVTPAASNDAEPAPPPPAASPTAASPSPDTPAEGTDERDDGHSRRGRRG